MRRREFISLVAGATAWPLEARAQRAGKPPIIGIIRGSSLPVNELVVQRLGELGWIEGHNIVLD
jgi:putative ABC transport system substrate-binding protein